MTRPSRLLTKQETASRPRTRWQRLAKLAREEGVAVKINPTTGEVTFLPAIHKPDDEPTVDQPKEIRL